jgi:hypothetical protein
MGTIFAVFGVAIFIYIFPFVLVIFALIFHGVGGNEEAAYMKTEFAKLSLPSDFKQQSIDCHDVELRQECYFTYTTVQTKATAVESLKQSFANAGYATGTANSQYSEGEFQNAKNSLYASVQYLTDAELAPAQQTASHESQIIIQMYKLQS